MCSGCPALAADGTLRLNQSANTYGVASVAVNFSRTDRLRPDNAVSFVLNLDIVVMPVNRPPSAVLPAALTLAQGCGAVRLPGFAANISTGPPNEAWQTPVFDVRLEAGLPSLWAAPPAIDAAGTLTLAVANGTAGSGQLSVWLSDDGGTWLGGRNRSAGLSPWLLTYTVYPMPAIVAVTPGLVPRPGGTLISVRGRGFGSRLNRPYPPTGPNGSYSVAVTVGGAACLGGGFVSDTLVTCLVPPGQGLADVGVALDELAARGPTGAVLQRFPRAVAAAGAVSYTDMYFGGVTVAADGTAAGAAAYGYDTVDAQYTEPTQAPCRLVMSPGPPLTRAVRAAHYYGGQLYLGGSFRSESDATLNYLVRWDGAHVAPAGGGMD